MFGKGAFRSLRKRLSRASAAQAGVFVSSIQFQQLQHLQASSLLQQRWRESTWCPIVAGMASCGMRAIHPKDFLQNFRLVSRPWQGDLLSFEILDGGSKLICGCRSLEKIAGVGGVDQPLYFLAILATWNKSGTEVQKSRCLKLGTTLGRLALQASRLSLWRCPLYIRPLGAEFCLGDHW